MLARLFNLLPVGVSKPDADLTAGGAPRAAPGLFRRRTPARRIKVFVSFQRPDMVTATEIVEIPADTPAGLVPDVARLALRERADIASAKIWQVSLRAKPFRDFDHRRP